MPLLSPIATQIRIGGGQTAVLTTPAVGDSTAYDPSSTSDFVPSNPITETVQGIYADAIESKLDARLAGLFRVSSMTTPPGLVATKSRLTVNGLDYLVEQVRTRIFKGEVDGFDLILSR